MAGMHLITRWIKKGDSRFISSIDQVLVSGKMMSLRAVFVVVLVLLGAALSLESDPQSSRHRRHRGERPFQDLSPQKPRVELESDGGRLEIWGGRGSGAFEEANVSACRVVLKPRGLWLPAYIDSPAIEVVTRGAGRVGIVTPHTDRHFQENTFKVVKGDVVAVREGQVVWWYNDEDEDMEIVGASDVTASPDAALKAFHLVGAKEDRRRGSEEASYAGIIHGFSKEILARAWEMDKDSVRELLERQSGAGIVRVDEDISFKHEQQSNVFFHNFIYRLGKAHADLRVEDGGELRELNSNKFPVLKAVGLGLECMQLEQDAMVSPNWFINAHQLLYVLRGRGRIEVVDNHGERALEADLEEGSLVLIPAFFPSTKIAAKDDSFHYITFVTSHQPMMSFLSGRKSVYRGIPREVLSRMLNVNEDQARQIQQAREKESIIFGSRIPRSETM